MAPALASVQPLRDPPRSPRKFSSMLEPDAELQLSLQQPSRPLGFIPSKPVSSSCSRPDSNAMRKACSLPALRVHTRQHYHPHKAQKARGPKASWGTEGNSSQPSEEKEEAKQTPLQKHKETLPAKIQGMGPI